jgi:class 3 adenylate cyclase
MEKAKICKGCWQNMKMPIPIRGALSIPLRLAGIRISKMHPNLCTICETQFKRVQKKKQIETDTTVLFADLRGYTSLTESSGSAQVSEMLNTFYDHCASAIWEYDGIINKFLGDAVLAVFNFPIRQKDHVSQAVSAALEIQRRCKDTQLAMQDIHGDAHSVGVGIGIHTGDTSVGQLGNTTKDFTFIGSVVNIASRVQGFASVGEIVITKQVYDHLADRYPNLAAHTQHVKGIDHPVTFYRLSS